MKLGLHIGYWGLGLSSEEQLQLVQEAERLGYDSVWSAEAYGSDAATILGWLSQATTTIRLGSAIFQMPGRSAAMTAMTAATLDQLSGGRMILGIGSSGPQVAEGWHGQRFARQLQRTREYVEVVRKALSRERLEYQGETLELPLPDGPGRALKLTIAPVQERIPIYLAAIGPKNTTLAAEIADGWIPTLFSPEHVAEFRPLLEQGFSQAGNGKGFGDFAIAPSVNVMVSEDAAGARDAMRPFVALYVGGMGSRDKNFYNALVRRYGFEDAAQRVQDLYLDGKRDEAAAALPEELIDTVSLCGPPDRVRDRLAVYRDAGVDTLMVSPMAWTFEDRLQQLRHVAELSRLKVFLGAFGDPGHAFPMLALGEALLARGHAVTLQTWQRWEPAATEAGMAFAAAPEYQVFPTRERPLKPYEAAVRAARETQPVVRAAAPDVAVSDILTPAPALAAELEGVPVATLVPHVHPHLEPGFPPYSIGARLPRTLAGRALWRATDRLVARGLEQGRREYNDCRARLGLGPLPWVHTGVSRALTLVATLPQLEYPREWPPWLRIVGPLLWEPPAEPVAPPPGDGPVVLVAPSTAQDPEHRLLRAALEGLAREPVRVIATWNRRRPASALPAPDNAVVVPWLSYARTMPACDVVITHGGHGTLMRALSCGCPVVVSPAGGDMAENAARVDWAGLGVRLPRRFATPQGVRLAVRRALGRSDLRENVRGVARWAAAHDGGARAAEALERWAGAARRG